MDRGTSLKFGLIAAGLPDPVAEVVVGVVGPMIDGVEAALSSAFDKNKAAAIASYYQALTTAKSVGDEAGATAIKALIDEMLVEEDDEGEEAGPPN